MNGILELPNADSSLRGSVSSGGGVVSGSGFDAEFVGPHYVVTFDTAFSETPIVIAQILGGLATDPYVTRLLSTSDSGFTVAFLSIGEISANFSSDFNFVAFVP